MTDETVETTEEKPEIQETEQSDSLITKQPEALDFSDGRPEAFPEEFWDAEKNTPNIDKLYKSYDANTKRMEGLRAKLSKGEFEGKAPDDPKEYTLELTDELKAMVPDDDPIVDVLRKSAKEAGLPKEAFNKMLMPAIQELAKIKGEATKEPSPEDIEAEREAKIAELGPSGSKLVSAIGAFIDSKQATGFFSEAEAKAAKDMVYDANSAKVMNKLRLSMGDKDQVPIDIPLDAKASRMDIEQKMAAAMVSGNEADYLKYSNMLSQTG